MASNIWSSMLLKRKRVTSFDTNSFSGDSEIWHYINNFFFFFVFFFFFFFFVFLFFCFLLLFCFVLFYFFCFLFGLFFFLLSPLICKAQGRANTY